MESSWSQIWGTLIETPLKLHAIWEKQLQETRGLTALHFHVLQSLAESPEGRLSLQELSERVRHSQSGTTRLVDRLEKDGLVDRQSCDTDRRVTWAMLSAKGQTVYEEAAPLWDHFLAEHLSTTLSGEEAETLRRILDKLQDGLSVGEVPCPRPLEA